MVASNDVYDSIPRSFTASLKKNDGDLVRPSLVSNPSNSEKNFTHKSFEVNSNLYENKYTKDCAIISNRNMKIRRSSDVQTSSNQRWLQNLYKKIEYEEKRFKEKVDLVTG